MRVAGPKDVPIGKTENISIPGPGGPLRSRLYKPVAAGGAFDEIWRYLRVLSESGGFFIYDPQLERVLNLEDDRPEAVDTYGSVVTGIPQLNERSKPQPKRPWWKLW